MSIWGKKNSMKKINTESSTILDIQNIDCFYGDLKVVRNASMKIQKSDVVALFGPNGHGKSTLLKAICGVHPCRSGSIFFGGQDITRVPVEKRVEMGLVYIPEDKNLFLDMTIQENLVLGAFNKRARKNIAQNLDFVFNLFPRLAERSKQLALTLSGGESRMLAIGRGMMSQSRLMLIDEPSIGLSPLLKKTVFDAIGQIRKQTETTVLIVEQEVDYPLKLANKIFLLRKGQIILEKHSDEIDKAEIEKAYF